MESSATGPRTPEQKAATSKLLFVTMRGEVHSVKSDVHSLKGDVKTMKGDYHALNTKVDTLMEMNSKIHLALIGDEKLGVKGMVAKVNEHDTFVQGSIIRQGKLAGLVATIGFVGGWCWDHLKELFH